MKFLDSKDIKLIKFNDYVSMCDSGSPEKCSSCDRCLIREEILSELNRNFTIIDSIKGLSLDEIKSRLSNDIDPKLYEELISAINKSNIMEFNITNLDVQFSLLTLLGFTSEEKNKIYQKQISNFFSLMLKVQKDLNVDVDIFGKEFTKQTLIDLLKLIKNMGFTDLNMYIFNDTSRDMFIKNVSISGDFSVAKLYNWKENINTFSRNVKNLLLSKDLKKTDNFNYVYSNIPVPGAGEDIAMLLKSPKEGLHIIFGFDHTHKAVDVGAISIIENFVNTVDNKIHNYFSVRDDLTGLLRRDKFLESLAEKKEGTFIIFDIDNFKSINDTFGHNVGDIVIKKVAKALSLNSREEKDIVCRWGGEEFVLFLDEVKEKSVIEDIYKRIQNYLTKINISQMDGRKITVSAGAYIADNIEKDKILEFIGKADEKLYESKKNGKNKITI